MSDLFSSKTDLIMQKMMDVLSVRHRLISDNIANVNTPGYRRKDIDFQDQLVSLIQGSDEHSIKTFKPEVIEPNTTMVKADMNNVDIEKEITTLAKNTLMYNTYASLAKKRYRLMLNAIKSA